MYAALITWLQQHLLTCPSKKLIYIDCPGCGFQRSVVFLLKGDIAASWQVYPPGIFIGITLLFLCLHLYFDFRHGAVVLKTLYIVSSIIVLLNYIYKITTNQLL